METRGLLGIVSPAKLKKYGLYAILSFFISFCVLIAADDISVRNADVKHERLQNDKLRKELERQMRLKSEQDSLFMTYKLYHCLKP